MAFSERKFLAGQIRLSSRGDAWHGPPLSDLLDGVDGSQALKRTDGVHSIREIAEHVRAWVDVTRGAIGGAPMPPSDGWPGDWPVTGDDWQRLRQGVENAIERLALEVESMPEGRLEDTVPGRSYDFRFLLYGIVQHNLYHAGQIALLQKL